MPEPKKALESHLHYTVGWIAPLPIERAAAKATFDEEHDKPIGFEQPKADPNSYSFGEIGGHNIVLASLKAGLYGTTSAAASATMMLRSFPEIRFGLLVGIGGAIPRSDRDIRLGDIVVSQPGGSAGGVIQYDLLKAKAGGVQERKDFLNSPPEVLLYALGNLQAQHEEEPSRVGEFLQEMENRKPFMFKPRSGNPGYSRPGPSKDRLFRPTYYHQGGPDCSGCAGEEEEKREPREDTDPVIHYGVIASGNTLVKNVSAREELLQHIPNDCLCYEMEAAGLMNNFPCLVIRGISDYSDSHKNDHWQRYASATAAAFAKELLGYVSADRVRGEEKALIVLEKLSKIETDVAHIKQTTVSLHDRREITDIDAWLSPVNVKASHNTACNMRTRGTCTWFLQGEDFQRWKRRPSSFLWLHGIVGCGKTVLSSAIIENLKTEVHGHHCVVLYYYFGSDSARDCLDGMVRTFLSQIIAATSEIPKPLWDRYKTCQQESTQAATESLLDDFSSIVGSLDEVKVVLDALDEVKVESRDGILTWIKENFPIQKKRKSRIGVIALSRPEPIFHFNFKDICSSIQILRSDVDRDIQRYVQGRLRTIQESRGWELSSKEMGQIEATLIQRANGMFRLVAVQIDSLRDCDTLNGLQEDIQSLPTTLTKMYDKIIQDISPKRKNAAIRLLQLLAYAKRPLRLDEVDAAILIDLSKTPSISSNRLLQKDSLPNYCPSLVLLDDDHNPNDIDRLIANRSRDAVYHGGKTVLDRSRTLNKGTDSKRCWLSNGSIKKDMAPPSSTCTIVRLAHFSVTEYLRSGTHDEFKEQHVHSIILQLSLGYLMSLSTISPDAPVSAVRRDYSFSDYASNFWPKHAKACERDQKAKDTIVRFLTDLQAFRTWIFVFKPDDGYRYVQRSHAVEMRLSDSSVEIPTPLQIATTFQLCGIVKALLDSSGPLSEQHTFSDSDKYDNRLLQAFHMKDRSWDCMLLRDGPIQRTDPLYIACFYGLEDIAMLLIEKGLDAYADSGPNGSPFAAACQHGCHELVHWLLDTGACQRRDGSQSDVQVTHLFLRGYWKPLKVLLDRGVAFPPRTTDPGISRVFSGWKKAFDYDGRHAIHRLETLILEKISWTECRTGYFMIRRVLQAKFDLADFMELAVPFIMDSSEIHLIDVIIRSHEAVSGLELHDAARSGDITFLRAVLPRWKSSFESYDQRGTSPLHHAAEMGHIDIIKILILAGFSPDVADNAGNAPLSWALVNHQNHLLGLLSPDQARIEQERTRLKKQTEIIAAIDKEDLQKLKDIFGAAAYLSFIKNNPVSKSTFRQAVLDNPTTIPSFMLSYGPDTPSWNQIGLTAFECALEAGTEFDRIYHCSPNTFAGQNGRSNIQEFLNSKSFKRHRKVKVLLQEMK